MAGTEVQSFYYKFFGDTKGFDKSLKNVENSLSKIGNAFGRLQKIVSLAVGGKIVADIASFGMKMGLLSSQTNIGIKSLTALSSAFTSAGSNAQTVQGVLVGLEKQLAGLSSGGTWQLGSFGISPYDETGKLKTSKDLLYEIADWAKRASATQDERDVIHRLMSSVPGIDYAMASTLVKGSDYIRAEEQRAIDEGRALDEKTKDNLIEINRKIKEMTDTWSVAMDKMVSSASPVLSMISDFLKDLGKIAGENPKTSLAVGAGLSLGGTAVLGSLLKKTGIRFGVAKIGAVLSKMGLWGLAAAIAGGAGFGLSYGGVRLATNEPSSMDERMERARLELARKGLIRYKPKGSLFYEPKTPEFPVLFGGEENKNKNVKMGSLFPESKKPEFPVLFGGADDDGLTAKDFIITDEAGNVLDLSQIHNVGSGGNNYDIKFDMTNNITTADSEGVVNAINNEFKDGISSSVNLGMNANTGVK